MGIRVAIVEMTDEAWVDFGALDDAVWHARILADFGMDLRPGG